MPRRVDKKAVYGAVKNNTWEGPADIAARVGADVFRTVVLLTQLHREGLVSRRVLFGAKQQFRIKPAGGALCR